MANFSVHKSSDFVMDYVCGACESKNIEQSADLYCGTCRKSFCVKCNKLHSQLYSNHSIYGRLDMGKWPLTKKVEDFLQKCGIHEDKKLEMFCQDHSQLCCNKCVLLNHRQCTSVTLISETIQNQSTDLQQLFDKIDTILEELKKVYHSREGSIQYVEISYNERLQEVREVRKKLNAALDAIEKTTLKELDDIRTSLHASLKTDVDNCNRLKDDLKELNEAIQELEDKSNVELLFIASQKGLEKIKHCEEFLKENCVKVDSTLSFQANTDIELYLSKQLGLGKILQRVQSMVFPGNPSQVFTVKQTKEYDVGIPNDGERTSYITGICLMADDKILVADHNGDRVSLLDEHYNVISYCDVSVSLGDICQISTSEVAVTMAEGYTHGIQFISVNSGQLVKGRKFNLRHVCTGIAHHEGNLYVTSTIALGQYSLTGELVKRLYANLSFLDWSSRGYEGGKCAVSPAGDKIYVTGSSQHQLLTLATDGTVLSTFSDPELQGSQGIHVTPAGQVLVCGKASNTIIQVDAEGKRKLATLVTENDGVTGQVSVCYNSNNKSVIVGQANSNTLLVIKLKKYT